MFIAMAGQGRMVWFDIDLSEVKVTCKHKQHQQLPAKIDNC